jgi:hypothetical protein
VPEVWIVDLGGGAIDAHREPAGRASDGPRNSLGGYRTRAQFRRGDAIAPAAFPDLPVPVVDILGGGTDPEAAG